MPPKKDGKQPNAPAKAAVDKTFGMKNKKGGAAQKQIKQLQSQAASNKSPEEKRKQAEKEQRQREKEAAEQAKKETAELFKPVQVQKVPLGVDPKTVLCEFYKSGFCEKGKKCKFSHDLSVGRKSEKINLYEDTRERDKNADGEEDCRTKDDMVDWDEEKLRSVVMSKHGNPKTTTDKVCKFFIDAVENGKYGWFWTCPNGGDNCKYKHSLPPGFVLKTREQRLAEKREREQREELSLEDFLDHERHRLTGTLTPVTSETFARWKKERMDKKAAEAEAKAAKDETGRAMFERGDFEESEDEGSDDETWNMDALRRETEQARQKKEEERLAAEFGSGGYPNHDTNGLS